MSDNSLKSLYFAQSFEDLKKKSDFKVPGKMSVLKCFDRMKDLSHRASSARREKDQELEFMYLHRYLTLLTFASSDPSVSKKDEKWKREFLTAQINEKFYRNLTEKLKARYQEHLEKSKPSCITIYPAEDTPNKGLNDSRNESKIRKLAEKNLKRGEIDCFELHKLVTADSSKLSFLIMDVRPPGHYEESHVNHKNILNISYDKIQPGMSANTLSKKFVDNDSVNLWKMRVTVDKLILLDWNSSLSTLEEKSPLSNLKDILLMWDHHANYKCNPPLILDGGYEELLARYPQITTNPRVKLPLKNASVVNNSLTSFDYPMEELEEEKKNIPKSATTKKLIVDRSSKPHLSKEEINEDDKILNDDSKNSRESSESISETSQLSNSVLTVDKAIKNVALVNKNEETTPSKIDKIQPKEQKPSDEDSLSSNSLSSKTETNAEDNSRSGSPSADLKSNIRLREYPTQPKRGTPSPHRELNELRKLKPHIGSSKSQADSVIRGDSSDSEEGIFTSPLKKDGGSGGLKRSSSSPNIAQLKDDDSFHVKHPTFTRANKPSRPSPHPVYGERTDSTYGTTSAGLTGLKNFANNCYMNSILQCLNNTEPLVKEMTALNKHTLNHHSRSKGRVAQEVIDAFRNMWSGEVRVYSIKELKAIMGSIKDIFKGTAHQDSNEFLIILLEHLHEDLNKPAEVAILDGADVESGEKAWGEFRRKNCSVIQRLFYGQHKSTVICSTCNHTSATFEQFFNLFVPIPSNQSGVTLNDCIQLYMSGERITGWKCPKCKTERNATKKFDISRLPPILVIALKRFTQEDDSWLQKKENVVYYPLEDLDMSKFTVAGSEQRYSRYNLYAMSIHSGTLKSGHYRAICKNYKNQKWYLFDDQIVEPLQVQNVKNNSEVYILFYNAVTH
ncbi:ubiquitin carboxyl-terminal hydrolase 8-like isoform X2 [Rhodnius prolixus]|uniref:ubiquitin carboxyl-terminal hydrolase 8-like isoform X2 n=1 Tax=Rhodnius prolixus TaxID=13249 RepID=UPI003D1899EB